MENTATAAMLLSSAYDPMEMKRRRIADAIAAKIIAETRNDIDKLPDSDHALADAHRIIQDAVMQAAYEATVEYSNLITNELAEARRNYDRAIEAANLLGPRFGPIRASSR